MDIELRALNMLGKNSTTELYPQPRYHSMGNLCKRDHMVRKEASNWEGARYPLLITNSYSNNLVHQTGNPASCHRPIHKGLAPWPGDIPLGPTF